MSTFLVSLVILAAVVLAVRSLKRSGGCSGCSGGCAGCHRACHCSASSQPAVPDVSAISAPRRTTNAYQGLEPPADR